MATITGGGALVGGLVMCWWRGGRRSAYFPVLSDAATWAAWFEVAAT